MEIEGKIIQDIPMVSGTSKAGNPWKKKEWVLETLGQYPRKAKFDFFGDRADNFRLEVGKVYRISFDVESRDFNGRWYTDLRAFNAVEIAEPTFGAPAQGGFGTQPAAPASPFGAQPAVQAPTNPFGEPNETDDLPF